MEVLKVQDLSKTYGAGAAEVKALQHACLTLEKGEFAAVVGDSGSGKSTLLNVEQNILFPLLLDGQKPQPGFCNEMLEILGLTERRLHLPSQLSGGQQQRVAIGRALITRPMLLLADEPTGNLDSRSSRDVMDLLLGASRRYQQTVLMITHNMALTNSADRVFNVSDGILTDLGGAQL